MIDSSLPNKVSVSLRGLNKYNWTNAWIQTVPPSVVCTSSSETASFYHDHRPPLSPVLTATSFPVCDHRKTSDFSLCLIRAVDSVDEATLGLIFLSTVQLLCWALPRCSTPGPVSGRATSLGNQVGSKVTWPNNFYELCSLFPPDLPRVTHHSLPPCTCTPISWFLEDATFLPASRPLHMLFPLPQRFSLYPSTLLH